MRPRCAVSGSVPQIWTPPANLVSWWKFDEVSGSTLVDEMGINPGNLGTMTRVVGHRGRYKALDIPTNACGNVPHSAFLDITAQITISVWLKHYTGTPGQWEDVIMKGNNSYGIQFGPTTDGKIGFHVQAGGWRNLFSDVVPTINVWYHVACVYDGSGQYVYIDGVQHGFSGWVASIGSVADDIKIGGSIAGDNVAFNGSLDNLMIFNRGLSLVEVQNVMAYT